MTFLTVHEVALRWRFQTDVPVYGMKDEIGYTKIRGRILFPVDRVAAYERRHSMPRETILPPCDAPGCDAAGCDLPTAPCLTPA